MTRKTDWMTLERKSDKVWIYCPYGSFTAKGESVSDALKALADMVEEYEE